MIEEKDIKTCTKCKIACSFFKSISRQITDLKVLKQKLIYEANSCKFYTDKL